MREATARRVGEAVLGLASLAALAVCLYCLVELRIAQSPTTARFATETDWLNYYWWYYYLPSEALFSGLLGACLGIGAVLAKRVSPSSARWIAMVLSLLLVNALYAIIPGGLFYRLSFYPPLEGAFTSGFISFVGWLPGGTRGLDLVGLSLLVIASVLAHSIWSRAGRAVAIRRGVETFTLGLLPLPVWVYLFDRKAFGLHIANVQAGTAVAGLSNEDLLAALGVILCLLLVAECGAAMRTVIRRGPGDRSGTRQPSKPL